ncbi:MAG: DEAD/DEAH box helicase, partial [Mucilaginibacter sp.]|nr:DEAD/DEAH box helicase [Mucilaginibacter sp.]
DALRRGVDILVATPGRLLDLINQGYVHINQIKMLILDEADRMLDMGFVNDVKKIIAKVPAKRQTLFFSATMPKEIQSLADSILSNPEKVEVAPVSSTADTIQQAVYFVDKSDKKNLLIHILKDKNIKTLLVFTRTKHGADKVVKDLHKAGVTAEAIHGNKSQNARQRALTNFKNRTTRVLIATDIAARGIDIDELSHVVNYELPNIPETYVHRIGRTGRAGASGIAMSFCDGEDEIEYLKDIHKLIGKDVPVEEGHPYPLSIELMNARMTGKAVSIAVKGKGPSGGGGRNGGGGNRGRNSRGGKGGSGEGRPGGGNRNGGGKGKSGSKSGGGSGMSGRR